MAMIADGLSSWAECFPRLAHVDDRAWLDAVQSSQILSIASGSIVLRPGDVCRHVLLLLHGSLRVYLSGGNGREMVLYRVQAGELCVLTLASVLRSTHYPAEAVTESETRSLAVPVASFKRAFSESEPFRQYVVETLAQRLEETMLCVQELAFMHLDVRLPWFLCRRFQGLGTDTMEVTHQQLAHELGTTREMVSRLLKELERQNYICLSRGKIQLVSPVGLRSMIAR